MTGQVSLRVAPTGARFTSPLTCQNGPPDTHSSAVAIHAASANSPLLAAPARTEPRAPAAAINANAIYARNNTRAPSSPKAGGRA